jgi:uncharacterized protein (DUF58 family)
VRRRLKITRQGQVFVAITFAVGIGALNTGNNLLFLCLGLMLSIITVSGILSELNVVDLEVRLPHEMLFVAGTPQFYEFEVRNPHRRRLVFAVAVRVKWRLQREHRPDKDGETKPHDSVEAKSSVLVIKPGQKQSIRGEMRFVERGDYRLEEILFQTEYPFGLFRKTRVAHDEVRVVVAPQPEAYAPILPQARTESGESEPNRVGHSIEPFDLREAQSNEDVRNIAWAKSAARGQMMAIRRASEISDAVVLAVRPGVSGDEPFERALRLAAGFVRDRMARGASTALITGDGSSVLGSGVQHERALMTMLALASQGAAALPRTLAAPVLWVP